MSGELHEDPVELFDSGYKPDLASARDVLAFVLTPARAFVGSVPPEEMPECEAMLLAAKQEACEAWRRLNKR